jgi:vancomycin permeability regulator SanA
MSQGHDVVIVFGAAVRADGSPSGALRRRIEAALNYGRDRSVIFLVTGGLGIHPPAESVVMANMLRAEGVPEDAIVQENQSKTTLESVIRCTAIIRGLSDITRVMVCSDAYHVARCRWLLRLSGIRAGGIGAASGRAANPWQKWLWFQLREYPAFVKDTILILVRRATNCL